MKRLQGIFLVVMVMLLAVSGLQGQATKDDPGKIKGVLPAYWGKLGLSDEQKQKVYRVQADYGTKIANLEKQIADLKVQQKAEMEKVLTDAQKAMLRDILLKKVPGSADKNPNDNK